MDNYNLYIVSCPRAPQLCCITLLLGININTYLSLLKIGKNIVTRNSVGFVIINRIIAINCISLWYQSTQLIRPFQHNSHFTLLAPYWPNTQFLNSKNLLYIIIVTAWAVFFTLCSLGKNEIHSPAKHEHIPSLEIT